MNKFFLDWKNLNQKKSFKAYIEKETKQIDL